MGVGYKIDWTTWRVWFHPRRACKMLIEAKDMEDDLSKRLHEALDLLEEQRKESARITLESASLCKQLAAKESELAAARRELDRVKGELRKVTEELEEHISIEEQLAEFNKKLGAAEQMKHDYEKRISELESRLKDAKSRLSERDDNELLDPIDMTSSRTHPDVVRPRGAMQPRSAQPRQGTTQSETIQTRPSIPQTPQRRLPDDEWLMELPDDL